MTRNELENFAYQWISLWCAPVDWEAFDRMHSDDFIDLTPAGRGSSKKDFAAGLSDFIKAFPDLNTRIEELVIDEASQRVAIRWRSTGTHALKYLGFDPSRQKIRIPGIEIIEVNEDRVLKRWGEWDISGLRQPDAPPDDAS